MSYAVVNFVRLEDPALAADATRDVVLPRLQQMEGYERAIFLADDDGGRGFSVIVFHTKEQADEMAQRLGSGQVPDPPGVRFERQGVWSVVTAD